MGCVLPQLVIGQMLLPCRLYGALTWLSKDCLGADLGRAHEHSAGAVCSPLALCRFQRCRRHWCNFECIKVQNKCIKVPDASPGSIRLSACWWTKSKQKKRCASRHGHESPEPHLRKLHHVASKTCGSMQCSPGSLDAILFHVEVQKRVLTEKTGFASLQLSLQLSPSESLFLSSVSRHELSALAPSLFGTYSVPKDQLRQQRHQRRRAKNDPAACFTCLTSSMQQMWL